MEDFHTIFNEITAEKDVLAILPSSKMSRAFDYATAAGGNHSDAYAPNVDPNEISRNRFDLKIVDSRMVSMGLGLMVVEAAERIEQGWSMEKVFNHIEHLKKNTRLGRPIVAEDIAEAAVYLAADARATTGQTILVDAGAVALGPDA